MNTLILWFRHQPPHEQRLLISAAAIVAITLFYLLIWEPVFEELENQTEKLQSQKTILAWMNNASNEVISLRAAGASPSSQSASQPISTLVERTAVSAGIRANITKMNSDKKQSLKVQFDSVEFDRLGQWFAKLQHDYAINPKSVQIKQTDKPGIVSCRVTLEKQAS
ncbi:MAG: type II secretion system protein M [Gammaproteobacteria bacterium]|nr:type II secretion system protein M [Gammaproteobacteria bacterium]